ncbi:hypothetical protein JCGZ_06489 [Jatropha curcas]|uniref:Uncharacterized protein n=1 Tax=Jatropha curcas TaxID=180498 RepID=A0A067LE15_JATCU|nr:hypothetical protein JCGZ_06489 [Jatropha curcas]
MDSKNCIDKLFGSTIFWVFMGLQAACTGGFIVIAVSMDIKYINEEDSPGTTFIAIATVVGIPVACFCFLFAGAAFFNVFHKFSSKKSSSVSNSSLLSSSNSLPKNKVSTFMAQEVQSMAMV